MSFKLFDGTTAIGASRAVRVNKVRFHTVRALLSSLAATKISACTVILQGVMNGDSRNKEYTYTLNSTPTLAIGTVDPIKVKNAAFTYMINGTNYTKAGTESAFTAAHVISASKYGVVNLYVNSAGTISSKVPLATQAYASAAAAHTAGDAIATDASKIYIGRILINTGVGAWTANTTNLTDADGVTTATFLSAQPTFINLATHEFTADEITAQEAVFSVVDIGTKYVRLYLSVLTGTGEVDAYYHAIK